MGVKIFFLRFLCFPTFDAIIMQLTAATSAVLKPGIIVGLGVGGSGGSGGS